MVRHHPAGEAQGCCDKDQADEGFETQRGLPSSVWMVAVWGCRSMTPKISRVQQKWP
jgi:hypothetical protein